MAVTETDVVEALRPVEDPELHRSIVDLGMVRDVAPGRALRRGADRPHRGRLSAPQRDPDAGSPTRWWRSTGSTRSAIDFTVMTDEERVALREQLHGDPAATAGTHEGHGHAEGRVIPFADPGSRTRVPAHRVGQGRGRQVVGHHQPGGRAGPARPLGRGRRRRRVGLLHPADARRRPTAGDHRRDAGAARVASACGASRWGSSPRRTSRSSGGARCCTRRSSSSSPTCSGTIPTSWSSTCLRAPATSPCRWPSSCPAARSTW